MPVAAEFYGTGIGKVLVMWHKTSDPQKGKERITVIIQRTKHWGCILVASAGQRCCDKDEIKKSHWNTLKQNSEFLIFQGYSVVKTNNNNKEEQNSTVKVNVYTLMM